MNRLPENIRKPAVAAVVLWMLVPIRVIADIIPGLEPVAQHLTGKSIDYLLVVTTLAAVGLTGYVMKLFIQYVMVSKKEQQERDDRHAQALKDLHQTTRTDLINATAAMDKLSDALEKRNGDQRMSMRGGQNG